MLRVSKHWLLAGSRVHPTDRNLVLVNAQDDVVTLCLEASVHQDPIVGPLEARARQETASQIEL